METKTTPTATATKKPAAKKVYKNKTTGTVVPAPKKVIKKKPVDTKALDTKNIKDTVKQVVESEREIKYKYPAEVDNQLDRKTFRQKVRNKLRSMERELAKVTGEKEKVKQEKALKAYRKEVLLVP